MSRARLPSAALRAPARRRRRSRAGPRRRARSQVPCARRCRRRPRAGRLALAMRTSPLSPQPSRSPPQFEPLAAAVAWVCVPSRPDPAFCTPARRRGQARVGPRRARCGRLRSCSPPRFAGLAVPVAPIRGNFSRGRARVASVYRVPRARRRRRSQAGILTRGALASCRARGFAGLAAAVAPTAAIRARSRGESQRSSLSRQARRASGIEEASRQRGPVVASRRDRCSGTRNSISRPDRSSVPQERGNVACPHRRSELTRPRP
jgi:hypothetical protein